MRTLERVDISGLSLLDDSVLRLELVIAIFWFVEFFADHSLYRRKHTFISFPLITIHRVFYIKRLLNIIRYAFLHYVEDGVIIPETCREIIGWDLVGNIGFFTIFQTSYKHLFADFNKLQINVDVEFSTDSPQLNKQLHFHIQIVFALHFDFQSDSLLGRLLFIQVIFSNLALLEYISTLIFVLQKFDIIMLFLLFLQFAILDFLNRLIPRTMYIHVGSVELDQHGEAAGKWTVLSELIELILYLLAAINVTRIHGQTVTLQDLTKEQLHHCAVFDKGFVADFLTDFDDCIFQKRLLHENMINLLTIIPSFERLSDFEGGASLSINCVKFPN